MRLRQTVAFPDWSEHEIDAHIWTTCYMASEPKGSLRYDFGKDMPVHGAERSKQTWRGRCWRYVQKDDNHGK